MKLVNFIDNLFQELRLEEEAADKRREFSLIRESKTHALMSLRKMASTITKWFLIPVIMVHYLLVVLGVMRKPEPVLVRRLEKLKEEEEAKKLKKIGMKDLGGGKSETPSPA